MLPEISQIAHDFFQCLGDYRPAGSTQAATWEAAQRIAGIAKIATLHSVLSPTPSRNPDYYLLRILASGATEANLVKRGRREQLAVHFLSESGKTIQKSFSPPTL